MTFNKRYWTLQALHAIALLFALYPLVLYLGSSQSDLRVALPASVLIMFTLIISMIALRKNHLRNRSLFDQLQTANQDLVRARETERMINRYLNIATHDIRNPLQVILSCSEMLHEAKETQAEMQHELTGYIAQSGKRILQMVEEMLDIQKMKHAGIDIRLREFRIHEILDGLVYSYRGLAKEKDIRIQLIDELRDETYTVDKEVFLQAADNLLSNAIKYSPNGTKVQIELLVESDGSLRLDVRDEGPGITLAEQTKLFQPFERTSNKPTGDEVSTGLGLSIVKERVQAAGGTIRCESISGQGSTFIVTFPQTG
ncbi:MAG: HAMP domain-containing sensor histidine kinase [Balneolaceae bacterium]